MGIAQIAKVPAIKQFYPLILLFLFQYEFGKGSTPNFTLPNGISRADLGRRMVDFANNRNFLDEFLWDLRWRRPRGLWLPVTNAERAGIIVREGNLLDSNFTQFPPLTEEQLHEIACGSYQTSLARQYGTNIVNLEANNNGPANDNVQNFNNRRSQPPRHVYCFFWDQVNNKAGCYVGSIFHIWFRQIPL